ncbi:MAG: hypothetical protein FWH11_08105 [Micrococcales bacterium]|nr:hypothetical protein [Micrococcales bacterium]
MLWEGLWLWVLAGVAATGLSIPLGYAVFVATREFDTTYYWPVLPNLGLLATVGVVCATVPLAALRLVRRGSLIERLGRHD